MKEVIAAVGLAILGVFIFATLTLGDTNSLKSTTDGVNTKLMNDMTTNVINDDTN